MTSDFGSTLKSRFIITTSICLAVHFLTRVLIGKSFGGEDIIYPEDPRYVDPKKEVAEPIPTFHEDFLLNFTDYTPRIAWLMSFPNSGTSFTMANTKMLTNRSIATNYADEVTEPGKPSLPLYPFHYDGPSWPGMVPNKVLTHPKELPDKYIMTKTHCGSRCDDCGPATYIETTESFAKACASGHVRIQDPKKPNKMKRTMVTYPFDRVGKAVHLIRNPYNNLVARFHLKFRHLDRQNRTSLTDVFPNNATGFQNWCRYYDVKHKDEDAKVFGNDTELHQLVADAPCHGEFYKYVQWHNLAFKTTASLAIPFHIIHYEEYEENFDETVSKLLDFLETPAEGVPHDFYPGHSYDDYFSKKDRQAVKKLVSRIASPKTLREVERYL